MGDYFCTRRWLLIFLARLLLAPSSSPSLLPDTYGSQIAPQSDEGSPPAPPNPKIHQSYWQGRPRSKNRQQDPKVKGQGHEPQITLRHIDRLSKPGFGSGQRAFSSNPFSRWLVEPAAEESSQPGRGRIREGRHKSKNGGRQGHKNVVPASLIGVDSPFPPAVGRSVHRPTWTDARNVVYKYNKGTGRMALMVTEKPAYPGSYDGRMGPPAKPLDKTIFLYPSLVMLATKSGDSYTGKCVGTLVAEHYILTAHTCTRFEPSLYALMGHWDKQNTTHEFFEAREIKGLCKMNDQFFEGDKKTGPQNNVALCELKEKFYTCKNGPLGIANLPKKDSSTWPTDESRIKAVSYGSRYVVQGDFKEDKIKCSNPCPCPAPPAPPNENPDGWPGRDMANTRCGTQNMPMLEDTDRGHPLYDWQVKDGSDEDTAHGRYNRIQVVIAIFSTNEKSTAPLYEQVSHHVKWIKDNIKTKNADNTE